MSTGYILAFIFIGVVVAGSFVFALTVTKNEALLRKRLDALDDSNNLDSFFDGDSKRIEELPLSERLVYPYLMRMSELMKRMTPQSKIEELNKKLIIAGNPKGMTAMEFLGMQGLFGIAIPIVFSIFLLLIGGKFSNVLLYAALFAGGGFILPKFWLNKQVTTRQQTILKSLPFTMDLLTISVDAGLGFDSAMDKVAQTMDGPISTEFEQVLAEMRLGKSKKDALKNMVERTEVEDLNQFVVAIIQAEKLGVGLSKLLKAQSKSMRQSAKQRAQEKAFKAPVKMLFPMIIFIFPSIFVVLLGPAALYLPSVFGGL